MATDLDWFGRRRRGLTLFRREMDNTSSVFLIVTFSFFFLFLIVPLALVSLLAFTRDGQISIANFTEILIDDPAHTFFNSDIFSWDFSGMLHLPTEIDPVLRFSGIHSSILVSTLFVGFFTTLFSVILGVTLAFIIARYDFVGKEIIRILVIIPLVVPPFIGALGLQLVFGQKNSLFNNLFFKTWHIIPFPIVIEGLFAIVLVQSLHFYTLVYLNSLSAFMNIDPTLEEQGENLGASGRTLFRKITFPLALPGITAGAILTFILSIEDVGTPLIYSSDAQSKQMLSFQIFQRVLDPNFGAFDGITQVYSLIMLVIAIIGFLIIRKYVSLKQYATYAKGGTFNTRTRQISSKTTFLFYLFFIPVMFIAFAPHIGTFLFSISIGASWITTRDVLPVTIDPRIFGLMFLPIVVYILMKAILKWWPKDIRAITLSLVVEVVLLLGLELVQLFIPNSINFVINISSLGLKLYIPILLYLGIIIFSFLLLIGLNRRSDSNTRDLSLAFISSTGLVSVLVLVFIDSYYFLLLGKDQLNFLFTNPISNQVEIQFFRPAYSPVIFGLMIFFWVFIGYFIIRLIKTHQNRVNLLPVFSNTDLMVPKSRFSEEQKTNILLGILVSIPFLIFLGTSVLWRSYELVFEEPTISRAAIVTLVLAFIAVLIIIVLGISASYILARRNFPGKSFLDIMVTLPIAVPGVVLALGYMIMAFEVESLLGYSQGGILFGTGPYFILIIAFSIRRFPFTVRAAYAGLQQTHVTYEEAAYDLGASQPRTLRKVVIPLIGANVFGGALVSFVYSLAEASTTLVWINTTDQATIPYLIYNFWALMFDLTFRHAAAALGILLILAQVVAITLSNIILRRRGSALTGL